jgi:hypothetical protein
MNRRKTASALWFLLVLGAVGTASAGFTMVVSITPPNFDAGNTSKLSVQLTNTGDETAYKGTMKVFYPSNVAISEPIYFDTMASNVTQKRTVDIGIDPESLPGTYPLMISLQFHDQNDYPIYMVFDSYMYVKRPSTSKIYGNMSSTEFPTDGTGTLALSLKNFDTDIHTAKVKLIVPESVSADRTEDTIDLLPRSDTAVSYQLSNFMALPGSDFTAFALIEYDDDTHHTTMAKGRIRIGQQTERPSYLLPAAGLAAVACIYAYFRFFMAKPNPPDAGPAV